MWVLVAESGEQGGKYWSIKEGSLTIGRGAGCDIFLRDGSVSRKHCVVSIEKDMPKFEDQGGRNTTLLNGAPSPKGPLIAGDKLTVGQTVFVIANSAEYANSKKTLAGADFTHHILSGEMEKKGSSLAQGNPQTIEDLYWIFTSTRKLSLVRVREHFVQKLVELLKNRFSPDGILIQGLPYPQTEMKRIYEDGTMKPIDGMRPLDFIDGTTSLTGGKKTGGKKYLEPADDKTVCSLVSPITVGNERIGTILIQRSTKADRYCEQALEALVAFCKSIGPLYQSVSAVERMVLKHDYMRYVPSESIPAGSSSPAMDGVLHAIQVAAGSELSVLITGETGAGKEVVSRQLHDKSPRRGGPFVTVNCAAIPSYLFENEIFGYEKGAFPGADKLHKGLFEVAQGGVLFLDGISSLSLENQAKLLRILENKTFNRVGGTQEISVDIRVFSATNVDLQEAVSEGAFRDDLYHRICGFIIPVPPLRERKSDIGALAEYFMTETCFQMNELPKAFSKNAIQKLLHWEWPGNVRELRMCIDRAVAYSQNTTITSEEIMLQEPKTKLKTQSSLADIERQHIMKLLEDNGNNISATSKKLGISRTTLYNKLTEYGERP